jgi:type II secretory pathway predicted ATPase ExeA
MTFNECAAEFPITALRTRGVDAVLDRVAVPAPLSIVTGEAGSGKTTLCLALARRFSPRSVGSIALTPPAAAENLRRQLLADFGIGELPALFDALVVLKRRAFLVVDDAHDLSQEVVIEILRIASVAAAASAPMHVVLVGRPSLDALLASSDVRPLVDGLAIKHTLPQPGENEIRRFVERRLWAAYGGVARLCDPSVIPPRLTGSAVRAIARASHGDLRIASAICDRIVATAARRSEAISGARVKRSLTDLGLLKTRSSLRPQLLAVAVGLATVFAVGALAGASRVKRPVASTVLPSSSGSTSGTIPLATPPPTALVPDFHEAAEPEIVAPSAASAVLPSFDVLRHDALDRAARLAAVPDVKALLNLQNAVTLWDSETKGESHSAVEALIIELERFINEAREKQLLNDGREFLSTDR